MYKKVKNSLFCSISCQFLASLLASPQALEIIQSNNYQTEIIHTWFRCSLMISSQDQYLLNLTRYDNMIKLHIGNTP